MWMWERWVLEVVRGRVVELELLLSRRWCWRKVRMVELDWVGWKWWRSRRRMAGWWWRLQVCGVAFVRDW